MNDLSMPIFRELSKGMPFNVKVNQQWLIFNPIVATRGEAEEKCNLAVEGFSKSELNSTKLHCVQFANIEFNVSFSDVFKKEGFWFGTLKTIIPLDEFWI